LSSSSAKAAATKKSNFNEIYFAPPNVSQLSKAKPFVPSKKSSLLAMKANAEVITHPNNLDILCGKDKNYLKHPGNQMFRFWIVRHAKAYQSATSRVEKMAITRKIVTALKERYQSRFLKPAKYGGWSEIDDLAARDKVSHALRFTVATGSHESEIITIADPRRSAKQIQPSYVATQVLTDEKPQNSRTEENDALEPIATFETPQNNRTEENDTLEPIATFEMTFSNTDAIYLTFLAFVVAVLLLLLAAGKPSPALTANR
jgi:hypothetical protein